MRIPAYISLILVKIVCKILCFITFPPKYPTDIFVFLSTLFFHLIPQFACPVLCELLLRVIRQRCDNYCEYRIEKLLVVMINQSISQGDTALVHHPKAEEDTIKEILISKRIRVDPSLLLQKSNNLKCTRQLREARYRKENPVLRILRFKLPFYFITDATGRKSGTMERIAVSFSNCTCSRFCSEI